LLRIDVLPAPHRMRTSAEFAEAIRHGRRAGSRSLVVYAVGRAQPGSTDAAGPAQSLDASLSADAQAPLPARVGFVVGKGVGGSVVRHRVIRQLRAQMADRLQRPDLRGSVDGQRSIVIRALPPAAGATSAALAKELDRALARLLR
jgi:ribonuclease P protein component